MPIPPDPHGEVPHPRGDSGIALALSSGGAKGIAHVVALEALDELGLRPSAIAGSSVGAVAGAFYAAGMSGREIRDFILARLKDPFQVARDLMACGTGGLAELFSFGGSPLLVDAQKVMARFLPAGLPPHFEALSIPLTVIATDYYEKREVAFRSGDLILPLAASVAIPGLFRPVEAGERLLIDGGATNPLPFDHLADGARLVIAVDVTGGPTADDRDGRIPPPLDVMFAAIQILTHTVITEKIARTPPAVVLRPEVGHFRSLDFFSASQILAAAEPIKDQLKRALDTLLSQA